MSRCEGAGSEAASEPLQPPADAAVDQLIAHSNLDATEQRWVDEGFELDPGASELLETTAERG